MIASGRGHSANGQAHLDECLQVARRLGDDWLTAWTLHALGDTLYQCSDYRRANEVFAEAKEVFAALGDSLGSARTLASMAREAIRTADHVEAANLFSQGMDLGTKLDNHIVIGCCMAGFAALAG